VKFPVVPEAGIIDEEIDVDFLGGKPVGEGEASVGSREVGCEDPNLEMGMEAAKVSGKFFEAIIAAGNENQAGGEGGELAGKLGSETGRGSGDERGATLKESHHDTVKILRARCKKGFPTFMKTHAVFSTLT